MEMIKSSQRYHRQIILKELGEAGQVKLHQGKVLVIGAGGLGCPVLQYLAAAGVGIIGIADHDTISLSNLHRQVLYTTADIGAQKVSRAAQKLHEMNPTIEIIQHPERLTNTNALDILRGYDVVVDATDNFPTRYLINDACVLLNKPLVTGAVSRFEGQLAVFDCHMERAGRAVNYRDLFPVQPKEGEIASCEEGGVLGVLPGIIGSMQAGEVIKLLTGIGQPLVNRLQTFSLLTNEWFSWEVPLNPEADMLLPKNEAEFIRTSYEPNCSTGGYIEIDAEYFDELRSGSGVTIVDVRESDELPLIDEFEHLQMPLSKLMGGVPKIGSDIIITVCQSGVRSREAAKLFAQGDNSKKVYSLRGGILSWKQKFDNDE
jgi:sulfur-carrier protein adenylyltransferase/sulfurtransferase